MKSCNHQVEVSSLNQAKRLAESGYPVCVLSSVAEGLSRRLQDPSKGSSGGTAKKVVIMPYMHGVLHILRVP